MGAPGTRISGLVQQHMTAMEKLAATCPSSVANATGNGNTGSGPALMSLSLKKLKREAAQRRKAQARTLKLRAEEQERLQRLEIDALVEQQRLQRLERQRCEEDARQLKSGVASGTEGNDPASSTNGHSSGGALQSVNNIHSSLPLCSATSSMSQAYQRHFHEQGSCSSVPRDNNLHHLTPGRGFKAPVSASNSDLHTAFSSCSSSNLDEGAEIAAAANSKGVPGKGSNRDAAGGGSGWRGNKETQRAKQAQQQTMRAAVESRRRLARGPRSGAISDTHPMLPLEDHRVVSTEYQAAGTQALMRVTLLAAGFVIGARGISARLIGQVTGAIVQSWTESCRQDSLPIRLFRIQGKKAVVQAAAALIEQAVLKYKELCDCKRRGEFVQREHVINGVEFYYQPPPRKAFVIGPNGCCSSGTSAASANLVESGCDVGNTDGGNLVDAMAQAAAVAQAQAQLSFTTHQVWLQHLHAQQQHDHMVVAQSTSNQGSNLGQTMHSHIPGALRLHSHDASQKHVLNRTTIVQSMGDGDSKQLSKYMEWQHQHQSQPTTQVVAAQQQHLEHDVDETVRCGVELELIDQGLQQSMASLEQALQQVRLEQKLWQHNPTMGSLDIEQRDSCQSTIVIDTNVPSSTLASPRLVSSTSKMQRGVSLWSEVLNGHSSNHSTSSHLSGFGVVDQRGIGVGGSTTTFPQGSSLFSIFGNGGLPIPIDRSTQLNCQFHKSSGAGELLNSSGASNPVYSTSGASNPVLASPRYHDMLQVGELLNSNGASNPVLASLGYRDILQDSVSTYPFSPLPPVDIGGSSTLTEYSLYGDNQVDSEELCVVCLEQAAGVRLMACGHTSFCLNCVQGLNDCPLCQEKIVGLHQCGHPSTSSRSGGLVSADNSSNSGGAYSVPMPARLNAHSYHSWNWVPGASV